MFYAGLLVGIYPKEGSYEEKYISSLATFQTPRTDEIAGPLLPVEAPLYKSTASTLRSPWCISRQRSSQQIASKLEPHPLLIPQGSALPLTGSSKEATLN